jgi:hypothetical protein
MEELYLEETRSTQRAAETPAKQLTPTNARETTPDATSSCALDNNNASSWPCRPPPRRARNPVPPPRPDSLDHKRLYQVRVRYDVQRVLKGHGSCCVRPEHKRCRRLRWGPAHFGAQWGGGGKHPMGDGMLVRPWVFNRVFAYKVIDLPTAAPNIDASGLKVASETSVPIADAASTGAIPI